MRTEIKKERTDKLKSPNSKQRRKRNNVNSVGSNNFVLL